METREMKEIKVRVGKEAIMPIMSAVDIGFGVSKFLSNIHPMPQSIPSVVVPINKNFSKLFDLDTISHDSLVVTAEEGTYAVGDYSMNFPTEGSKRTQARNRAEDEKSRVLFKTVIGLTTPHETGTYDVFLTTGLPNEDFDLSVKNRLEEFLGKGFEIEFYLGDGRSVKKLINIIGFEIVRQPEGSVTYNQFEFDLEYLVRPKKEAVRMLGIIDIGQITTDFALFQDGVIMDDEETSGSTVAITKVYNLLKKRLVKKFDAMGFQYKPSDKDLDLAIKERQVPYMGKLFDVSEEVEKASREVAEIIAGVIFDTWGTITNQLELIILTGGGAYAISQHLQIIFEENKKQNFVVLDDPQFANVIGFYMYGVFSNSSEYSKDALFARYINPVFKQAAL